MKFGIALVVLTVMSMPLLALDGDEKSSLSDKQLTTMQKRLQLSDEQMSQMRKIRDEGGSKKEMGAVLTDEQKARAKEQKARAKEQKSTMTDEQLSKLQKQVQLSDQQMSKMRKIREDGGTRKEIFAVLSNEQKAQLKEDKKNKKCGNKCEKKSKGNTSDAKPAIKAE
jgi:hypothetical protein